jgi:HSP20 family protein
MTGRKSMPRNVSRLLSERGREAGPHAPSLAQGGGLADFFARLAEAAQALGEASAETLRHGGEMPFSLGGKQGRAVFGYTVRMGLDGVRAEPFGDAVPGASGKPAAPHAAAPRAPIVDIFEEGEDIRVVAELPGAAAPDVACTLHGTALHINAAGAIAYQKIVELPAPVDFSSLRQSCHNGILDVRLRRAAAP